MNEEALMHIEDYRKFLVENAIQQQALLMVVAARIANIEAHLTDASGESIYREIQNDVKLQIVKLSQNDS